MYLDHFALRRHPFRLTPDADFLYLSPAHARAKACVEQASCKRGAVVLLTGETGCGKSILINRIMAEMPPTVSVARLTQTDLNVDQFLQALLTQFGFKPFDRDKTAVRSLLDNYLFAQSVKGHQVLLVIEEAQNLSREVLQELSELADLEEGEARLISVVLVGQPSLRERMEEKELAELARRARGSVHLDPLSFNETVELIEHRLSVVGCDNAPFDTEAYKQIYTHTGGVPRLVVSLCDTALTAAYVNDSATVTRSLVDTAISELKLRAVAEPDNQPTQTEEQSETVRRASVDISKGGKLVRTVQIFDTRVLIGRDSDNDIVLISEFISRHHAQISMDARGRFWIKDLNSTNGAYINGRRTQRGLLHDGDIIQLGQHQLVFRHPDEQSLADDAAAIDDWRSTRVLDDPDEDVSDESRSQASGGHS